MKPYKYIRPGRSLALAALVLAATATAQQTSRGPDSPTNAVAGPAVPAAPAETVSTNAPSTDLLVIDSLGKLVSVPTNEVPPGFLPPAGIGITNQIPTPARGQSIAAPVQERQDNQRAGKDQLQFFPPFAPPLAPYLGAQDEPGNSSLKTGALIPSMPLDSIAQGAKYWASEVGLRYSLQQTLTFVGMSGVMQGDDTLGFYTLSFAAKWAVYYDPPSGTAGWLSTKVRVKTGVGESGDTQSAQSNLGTLVNPTGIWASYNGIGIQEMAWQQSFRDGELVVLAGIVDQGNYLDANTYANSGRGQFLNSALINSMVLPLPSYGLGVNLQWQFNKEWYAMIGASSGTNSAGDPPWQGFTFRNWSVVGELGYVPEDFLGLGPGAYRIQPFVAQATGVFQTNYTVTIPGTTNTTDVTVSTLTNTPIQVGLCFNLQQQLGKDSPIGWFGRFGLGGSLVTSGAKAQVGTGFVIRGPLAELGLFPSRKNDGAGIGFVWSQPSASSSTPVHENEYALEAGYVLQLTPLIKLQPDLQVVWNPAYNPSANQALVFQLQLDVAW